MGKMDRIFEIIAFSLSKIERDNDWLPLCDLVLGFKPHNGQKEFLEKHLRGDTNIWHKRTHRRDKEIYRRNGEPSRHSTRPSKKS